MAGQPPPPPDAPPPPPRRLASLLGWRRAEYADLPGDYRRLLSRHERTAWSIVLALLALYAVVDFGSEALVSDATARAFWRLALLALLGVGAVLLSCRLLLDKAADEFRLQEVARTAGEETARLQGALLAARTMQHHLRNQLTLTLGYAELLAQTPGLPDSARQAAQEALDGATSAVNLLDELQNITRLEPEQELQGPAMLDLERSRGEERD